MILASILAQAPDFSGVAYLYLILFVGLPITWLVNIAISMAMGLIAKAGDMTLFIGTVAGTVGTALPIALAVWFDGKPSMHLTTEWAVTTWCSTFALSLLLSLAMMLGAKKLVVLWSSRTTSG